MTPSEELKIARERLFESLGQHLKLYFHLLRQWFSLKLTKEDFDLQARQILNPDQTHLHNEFLLCLFNKCRSLGDDTYKARVKDGRKAKFNKVRKSSDKGAFQLADPALYIKQSEIQAPLQLQEEARSCLQELFLPDQSLVMSRLLLRSWELGLGEPKNNVADLLVTSVQLFLKNILSVTLSFKCGYKFYQKKFKHEMGSDVPNPWLRNYKNLENNRKSPDEESSTKIEEIDLTNVHKVACSASNLTRKQKNVVTTYDLLHALRIHKSTIQSHTLYSVNLEKIISSLYHPSQDEIDALQCT